MFHDDAYWISAVILLGLMTNAMWLLIKARVNEKLPDEERFSYLKREYSLAARKYQELYPEGRLPAMARSILAVFLVVFGALVFRALFSSQ